MAEVDHSRQAGAQLTVTHVGDRGIAVLPGQSGEEVLAVAKLIERETELGPYSARDVARMVIAEIARVRGGNEPIRGLCLRRP